MKLAADISIRVQDLHKSFGGRDVLAGVDLEIQRGESVVILGFSGSGKTVLLKHVTGFLEPDRGRVEVLGKSWSHLSEEEKHEQRRNLGIVFQNSALFDFLTIEENLTVPLSLREDLGGDPRQTALARLAEVRLSEADAQQYPVEISGGMQKRAAIARALAVQPKILFYDEPTAGLDPQTATVISALIREVNDAHSETTSYTITHDYDCAATVGDRVFYLDKQTGTLREVLSADEIRHLRTESGETDPDARIRERLKTLIETSASAVDEAPQVSERLTVSKLLRDELASFVETLGEVALLFFQMGFPLRWRDFVDRVFAVGVHSFPLILGAGFFVGMTGMVQFYVGAGRVKEILPVPMPATLASALLEIISPLLVGVLLAGRVGSHISTEIGSKSLLHQMQALESLAIPPKRFLLAPIVWALFFITPVMTLLCTFSGIVGGSFMWMSFGEPGSGYWSVVGQGMKAADFFYALGKSAVTGVLVGLVGYQLGARSIRSTEDIAAASTRTVLTCAILIVIFDFLFSFLYTKILGL